MFGAFNPYSPVTSPAQSRRSSVVPGNHTTIGLTTTPNTAQGQATGAGTGGQPHHQSNTLNALEAAANFFFGEPSSLSGVKVGSNVVGVNKMGGGPTYKVRAPGGSAGGKDSVLTGTGVAGAGSSSTPPVINAIAGPSGSRPVTSPALPSAATPTADDQWSSRSSSEGVVEIIKSALSDQTPVVGDPATSSAGVWAGEPSGSSSGEVVGTKLSGEFSPSPSPPSAGSINLPTRSGGLTTASSTSSSKGKQASHRFPPPTARSDPKDGQVRLLFSKSHVYIHPSQSSKDNIPGWLGLAEVPSGSSIEFDLGADEGGAGEDADQQDKGKGKGKARARKEVILFWIPTILAEKMEESERYEVVEERARPGVASSIPAFQGAGSGSPIPGKQLEDEDEEDYVFVTLPTKPSTSTKDLPPSRRGSVSHVLPNSRKSTLSEDLAASFLSNPDAALDKARAYAFSLPLSQLYSLLVYPPSLRNWYGCVTINLLGGVSLPGLWFHDDESGSTLDMMTGRQGAGAGGPNAGGGPQGRTGAPWGFTPFHASLLSRCELLKSSLVPNLYLINPTRMDREVHEIDLGEEANQRVLPRAGGPSAAAVPPSGAGPSTSASSGSISKFGSPSATATASVNKTTGTGSDSPTKTAPTAPYPPKPTFPSAFDSPLASAIHPARTQLLSSFSKFTQSAKKLTEQALSQPMFEPFVPLMPEPVRSLVTVPGEWESKGKRFSASLDAANGVSPATGGISGDVSPADRGKSVASVRAVAGEYESARVYLARWARVVAEEGERARQAEISRNASLSGASTPTHSKTPSGKVAKSELGVFELVKSLRGGEVPPATTRTPGNPVTEADFQEWQEKGLAESYLRGEVFRRGISEEGEARKMIWEVLLGVVAWEVGLQDDKEMALKKRAERRNEQRREYERLRGKWQHPTVHPDATDDDADSIHESEEQRREEWHRIDLTFLSRDIPSSLTPVSRTHTRIPARPFLTQVDCRRTDRTQAMFMVPEEARGDEEKEGGGASADLPGADLGEAEEGSQTALNPHTATLRLILMTYHQYSPQLGYVQGMSDLLSPIYVVFEADEAISFWAFVGWMRLMENNFLRDQSGMKSKLSTLQQLIEVMDPQLYRKLVRTDSLNLFFCFRWILIAFKREFKFEDVIRLWDILFTSYYSDEFVLFIALAILHSHREVIIRYLIEFDEVLKYANDLSGTIDLQSTLAQAEVLFLSFRSLVEQVDRNEAVRIGTLANAAQADEDDAELRQRSVGGGRGRRGSVSAILAMAGTTSSSETTRSLSVHGRGEGTTASNASGLRSRRGSDASVKTARSVADDVREREHRELVSDDLRGLLIGFKDL